jgi:hypothetical protein
MLINNSYAQLKMMQNIYKQAKRQNCRKYFSKSLCLFPKQFITSHAPQTKNNKFKRASKDMRKKTKKKNEKNKESQ